MATQAAPVAAPRAAIWEDFIDIFYAPSRRVPPPGERQRLHSARGHHGAVRRAVLSEQRRAAADVRRRVRPGHGGGDAPESEHAARSGREHAQLRLAHAAGGDLHLHSDRDRSASASRHGWPASSSTRSRRSARRSSSAPTRTRRASSTASCTDSRGCSSIPRSSTAGSGCRSASAGFSIPTRCRRCCSRSSAAWI